MRFLAGHLFLEQCHLVLGLCIPGGLCQQPHFLNHPESICFRAFRSIQLCNEEQASHAALGIAQFGQQLLRLVKEVTSSTDEIELDTQFVDAGMDSLSGVTLVTMMSREFGMSFTPSTVFDYPSVRTLRDHLLREQQDEG